VHQEKGSVYRRRSNMMYTFYEHPVVAAVLVSSRIEVTILFDLHTVSPCRPVFVCCLTKMQVGSLLPLIYFSRFGILFLLIPKACSISDLAQYNAISLIL